MRLNLRSRLLLGHLVIAGASLTVGASLFKTPAHLPVSSQPPKMVASSLVMKDALKVPDPALTLVESSSWLSHWTELLPGVTSVGLFSLWLTSSILLQIKRLEKVTTEVGSGDLSVRCPDSPIPEFAHLGNTFNTAVARLEAMEERRKEVIGDLSHELGTPLTVFRAYLEMINEGRISLTPEIAEQLHEEAERMARLLEDLRLLSKADAGELPIQLSPIDAAHLIKQTVSNLNVKDWNPDCQLELQCSKSLPRVLADGDKLKQVLLNLITNGLRYTPKGKVTVRAWATRETLWLSVSDTGIGITPEEMRNLFSRFWRSQRARKLRNNGSGIALAITKHLVELQGGHIDVESQVNQGSTFKVSLPLAQ